MQSYIDEVKNIRTNWAIADAERDKDFTTPDEIERFDNISYGPYGDENLLDVYIIKGTDKPMPTIVNIHGGAWVYGSKEVYQYYCMNLALRGFTVVNINYRVAPENHFPAPLVDVNEALSFITTCAKDYYIDTDNIILIGDSAGAQIASQYATIYSNTDYAKLFDFEVPKITIRALGLNCGCYDTKRMFIKDNEPMFCGYLGINPAETTDSFIDMLDVFGHMTEAFPPSYIISAQNDFLLAEVEPMHSFLRTFNIPAEYKIYGTKEQKEIGHVFCVNIALDEATICNDDQTAFFKKYIKL